MRIHWHRRDLRITDNRGLSLEIAGPIRPVFIIDPAMMEHSSPPRVSFLLDALGELRAAYRDRGSDLLIRRGDPASELTELVERYDAEHVTWNVDYSGLARRRDERVRRELADASVETSTVHDAVAQPPGEITTAAGGYYQVFSYYAKKWRERPMAPVVEPPAADRLAAFTCEYVPSIEDLGFDPPEASVPPAGTEEGEALLDAFCAGPIHQYAAQRDIPVADATSHLSPHLRFGTIGIRRVIERVESALETTSDPEKREGITTFLDQLAWREFYTQVLWENPHMVQENIRAFSNEIEWREDPGSLRRWKEGTTGFPLVDAGMRQLRREAWMHNRVRMVVASFLTKDLLIDWREGYEWFREKLVDHDPANDAGGWQWAASTGTDAQPYFRIFNPSTQCERYDPDGEYVKRYVPELGDAPPRIIHEWPSMSADTRDTHAPEYVDPIVDHAERRELALEMFQRARGETE